MCIVYSSALVDSSAKTPRISSFNDRSLPPSQLRELIAASGPAPAEGRTALSEGSLLYLVLSHTSKASTFTRVPPLATERCPVHSRRRVWVPSERVPLDHTFTCLRVVEL